MSVLIQKKKKQHNRF